MAAYSTRNWLSCSNYVSSMSPLRSLYNPAARFQRSPCEIAFRIRKFQWSVSSRNWVGGGWHIPVEVPRSRVCSRNVGPLIVGVLRFVTANSTLRSVWFDCCEIIGYKLQCSLVLKPVVLFCISWASFRRKIALRMLWRKCKSFLDKVFVVNLEANGRAWDVFFLVYALCFRHHYPSDAYMADARVGSATGSSYSVCIKVSLQT